MNSPAKKTVTPAAGKSVPVADAKKVSSALAPKSAIVVPKPAVKATLKKDTVVASENKLPEKPIPARAKAPVQPLSSESNPVTKPVGKTTKIVDSPKSATPVEPNRTAVRMASAPLKPGRRSSARTAVQTPPPAPMVPTHAPDAAKASYSTMIERVIVPPIYAAAPKDPKLANNWKTKSAEQLTDEEVKSMPDAEYMNEKQLAFFRHKLSVLKQDIHDNAGQTTENLREDTSVVPDPADRATIEEEHALELRTRDRERKLLKKIEQSIASIDSGDYGYCDETGEAIGVGRLIARPTANLSLEAQQRRELKQKMFGD